MNVLRFSINKLSSECGLDRRTLGGLLRDIPSADGTYSLANLVDALLRRSATAKVRLEKLTAETELAQQEVEAGRQNYVDLGDFQRGLFPSVTEMIRVIESSAKLDQDEKDHLRQQLADILRQSTPPTPPEPKP